MGYCGCCHGRRQGVPDYRRIAWPLAIYCLLLPAGYPWTAICNSRSGQKSVMEACGSSFSALRTLHPGTFVYLVLRSRGTTCMPNSTVEPSAPPRFGVPPLLCRVDVVRAARTTDTWIFMGRLGIILGYPWTLMCLH